LRSASRPDVLEQLRSLFKVFLESFARRATLKNLDNDDGEREAIGAFLEMTVKLNETAFRPLFRKMFDWAFVDGTESEIYRQITFCNIFSALIDYFKVHSFSCHY
jgi:U3 small nucleolar RNA-associated protein 10